MVPRIYTSYYSSPILRQFSHGEVSKISISIHPPKGWVEKGGLHYPPLCPSERIFWDVKTTGDKKKYVEELLQQFNRLDPNKVLSDLFKMSGGKPVILLCYESPQPTVGNNNIFCHRTVVSGWLGSKTGLIIPELTQRHVSDLLQKSDGEESLF